MPFTTADKHQIVIVLGEPERTLADGLRRVGLSPVAEDGEAVIWSRRLSTADEAPDREVSPEAGGPASLLMTVVDAARALRIGRSTVYELIGRGDLEVVHVGRSARIPTSAVRALVDRLQQEERRLEAS